MKGFIFSILRYLEHENKQFKPVPEVVQIHTETTEDTVERVGMVMLASDNQKKQNLSKHDSNAWHSALWQKWLPTFTPYAPHRARRWALLSQYKRLTPNPTWREQNMLTEFRSAVKSYDFRDYVCDGIVVGGVAVNVYNLSSKSFPSFKLFTCSAAVAAVLVCAIQNLYNNRNSTRLHEQCVQLYEE